jgi:hypothetical protein
MDSLKVAKDNNQHRRFEVCIHAQICSDLLAHSISTLPYHPILAVVSACSLDDSSLH